MIDSLYIATTGLNAQQSKIDVISNNIANVSTVAYKKNTVNFQDILYKEVSLDDVASASGANAEYTGFGVSASSNEKVFTDGNLKVTNSPLDLAIIGKGFFEVSLTDGTSAFTRAGAFKLDNDGFITDKNGNRLATLVQIPADYESIYISPDGLVSVKLPNETSTLEVGRLEMSSFVNPNGLRPMGNNLYASTFESGDGIISYPGENGLGQLSQGYLESSNVEYVGELTDLVLTQRAYEMNSKMIQVSDQIMGIINNLYRS